MALDFDPYRSLSAGQQVWLTAESPGQDGYPWRAVRVLVAGTPPAVTGAGDQDSEGAYASELTIAWDGER